MFIEIFFVDRIIYFVEFFTLWSSIAAECEAVKEFDERDKPRTTTNLRFGSLTSTESAQMEKIESRGKPRKKRVKKLIAEGSREEKTSQKINSREEPRRKNESKN